MDDAFLNRVGGDRIAHRQIDELIGIARGLIADGALNQAEVEFLQKWLAANAVISDQPIIRVLYRRVTEALADGMVDDEEKAELLDTLSRFSSGDFELGEVLKATSLPLCDPPPQLTFAGQRYCFTGTFNYGQRKHCEQAVKPYQSAGDRRRTTKWHSQAIGKSATSCRGLRRPRAWAHSTTSWRCP